MPCRSSMARPCGCVCRSPIVSCSRCWPCRPTGSPIQSNQLRAAVRIASTDGITAVPSISPRSTVTDLALFGSMLAAPAADLLPPGVPGHLNRQLPAYNPVAARTALDQASFSSTIDLYFSTNATVGRVAADLQDQLSNATGRSVVLHPTGDFFNQAALDKLPFFIDTWSADVPYPSDILETVLRANGQFNNLRLFDPEIERALDQGRAAASWDAALSAYRQAEAVAVAQNRVIPLYSGVEP